MGGSCVQLVGFAIISAITISKFGGDAGGLGGGAGSGNTGNKVTLN